ncbi:MAG: PH domain-containing protein [Actinomycetota bacterium]|nr:PH domain-containing protein [Actinomycetota bacterium]
MVGPQLELMPGERMVIHSHPHWWFFWKQVLAGVGVLALAWLYVITDGALGTFFGWVTLLALVVWLANTVYQFVQWQTTRFAVTDQRVAYQSGFFHRRGVSIPLNRVNNVNFEQTLIARILGNGILTIESAGETGDSVFENIPHPEHVRQAIFQQVEADEASDSERDAAALARAMKDSAPPPPAAAGQPSAQERLSQLEELRAQGLVSDEEYAAKRATILEDL